MAYTTTGMNIVYIGAAVRISLKFISSCLALAGMASGKNAFSFSVIPSQKGGEKN